MIVVRADDDVLVRLARQIADDVVCRFFHRAGRPSGSRPGMRGEEERLRLQILVDGALRRSKFLPAAVTISRLGGANL